LADAARVEVGDGESRPRFSGAHLRGEDHKREAVALSRLVTAAPSWGCATGTPPFAELYGMFTLAFIQGRVGVGKNSSGLIPTPVTKINSMALGYIRLMFLP